MTTRLGDVIVPSVFENYIQEQTAERSELFQSGIIAEGLDLDLGGGGKLFEIPFFKDLSGEEGVRQSNTAITVDEIESGKDVARLHGRDKAWGAEDLTAELTSGDPMQSIANRVTDYWNRRMQALLIATLEGIFAEEDKLVHDISKDSADDDSEISGEAILDAKQLLGDAKEQLTAMVMHSYIHTELQKDDLIDYIPDSQANVGWGTYMGNTVIVDDGVPVDDDNDNKYTTYLFGSGAVAYQDAPVENGVETDRDSLADENILINRRNFLLHPRGFAWQEEDLDQVQDDDGNNVDPDFPSNNDVEKEDNWERVYELKNIRVAKLLTN